MHNAHVLRTDHALGPNDRSMLRLLARNQLRDTVAGFDITCEDERFGLGFGFDRLVGEHGETLFSVIIEYRSRKGWRFAAPQMETMKLRKKDAFCYILAVMAARTSDKK